MTTDHRTKPCATCAEYRRGDRENVVAYGFTVHACERKRVGQWSFLACPCGCVNRTPGLVAHDRAVYGNAFLGPLGERIDPTIVGVASPPTNPQQPRRTDG